ncbi:hypothetical protein Tco_0304327 [Tanacetum coccineum]
MIKTLHPLSSSYVEWGFLGLPRWQMEFSEVGVLTLEQSKTAQDLVIIKLKRKVGILEKKLRARTPGMKTLQELLDVDNAMENVEGDAETQGRNSAEQITTRDTVNTATIDVSADGPSNVSIADPSTSTTRDVFEDVMMTIVDTLVAIRSTRPRTTSVIIHDVEEEPKRSTPAPTAQPSSKDKGKALMAELERMQRERAAQEEASNATLIAEFDNVQARMEANALLAARLQEKEKEQFSINEQARFLVETIAERKLRWKKASSSKKRSRSEPDEESVKRQKIRETSGLDGGFTSEEQEVLETLSEWKPSDAYAVFLPDYVEEI